jgi:hypothetical protein
VSCRRVALIFDFADVPDALKRRLFDCIGFAILGANEVAGLDKKKSPRPSSGQGQVCGRNRVTRDGHHIAYLAIACIDASQIFCI